MPNALWKKTEEIFLSESNELKTQMCIGCACVFLVNFDIKTRESWQEISSGFALYELCSN